LFRFRQSFQQQAMQLFPHPGGLPVAQPPPAGHPAATSHFQGQHFPRNASPEHKQDPAQDRSIRNTRPTPFWVFDCDWKQGLDHLPEFITHKLFGHAPIISILGVLLEALNHKCNI
jgi:hypothetical protein